MGRTVRARNADQYAKIAKTPRAAWLKVADRIANEEAVLLESNTGLATMYLKESNEFEANVVSLLSFSLIYLEANFTAEYLRERYFVVRDALKRMTGYDPN